MHELLHVWIYSTTCEPRLHCSISKPAVHTEENSVPDQPVARVDDAGVVPRDKNEGAYEFEECTNLGRLVPNDSVDNADSFQVFATVSKSYYRLKTLT